MIHLNAVSENDLFKKTTLYQVLKETPIGFVDAGSAGGVHESVWPIASIVNCLCFEPNPAAMDSVTRITKETDFSGLTISSAALNDREGLSGFHVTRSEVNSSILEPDRDFIQRYDRSGFEIAKKITVKTSTLDKVVKDIGSLYPHPADFIKIDCQGAEYDILQGARETLEDQCIGLYSEVEFFQIYSGQKTFSEVDRLVRQYGFVLYGLSPNYTSKRYLDRSKYDTNERLMWADVLYFKDPLDPLNRNRSFPLRSIYILIVMSLVMEYFDYCYELIMEYIENNHDKEILLNLVKKSSSQKKDTLEKNAIDLMDRCRKYPSKTYLYAKKYIDSNSGNNNIDHINPDEN